MTNPIRNIKIPKIVRKLKLADFDESLKEQSLQVWVNPPAAMLRKYNQIQLDIRKIKKRMLGATGVGWIDKALFSKGRVEKLYEESDQANDEIYAWYAEIWSQHELPDTHVTAEEVRGFHEHCQEKDLGLWQFVSKRTQAMIMAHQEGLGFEKN